MDNTPQSAQLSQPDRNAADWALLGGKMVLEAGVSLVPGGGVLAAAIESLEQIVGTPLERRQRAYIEEMAIALAKMQARMEDVTPERLSQNEAFISAYAQAAQAYMRTHLREKHEALCNAVLNVAASAAPDDNLQLTFLGYIDALTPWHLALLDCINDPRAWANRHHLPLSPSWPGDARLVFEPVKRAEMPAAHYDAVVLQDLYNRGLAADDTDPNGFLGSSPELFFPHITELGKLFLAFITSPIPDESASDTSAASSSS